MKLKLTELTEKITPLPWKTTGSLFHLAYPDIQTKNKTWNFTYRRKRNP